MRIFLTGSEENEWRWELSDFLREQDIAFFDSAEDTSAFSSIFKRLKILESCDSVVAWLPRHERQHLQTALELSYASKLAKQIFLIDRLKRRKSWIHAMPYTLNFPTLDGLKDHLCKIISTPEKTPLLWG
jgi:hypothetical protein